VPRQLLTLSHSDRTFLREIPERKRGRGERGGGEERDRGKERGRKRERERERERGKEGKRELRGDGGSV
jgi:hypothetical protein